MQRIIFLALLSILLGIKSFSFTYFVSPSGNDLSNGKSPGAAFRTLQKAANIVIAGDSVLVSDSTYAGFDIRTSGTSSDPIVFLAIGSQVIINRRNAVTPDGINIENANWIEIKGFRVINQPRAGIRAALSDHITIRNNTCLNNQRWGIFTGFTDDFIAEYNECAYSAIEHGMYVSNSSDRAIVRYNVSHHNRAAGLHFNGDISQGEDGINHDPQVYGNIIYRNGLAGGSAINMDGNQNALIYNNVLYNNYATGIALYQIDGGGPSSGARIYHNTIVQDDTSRWCILMVDGASGATIKNNILINQHSFRGSINVDPASRAGLVSDYNIMTNRFTLDDNSNVDSVVWKGLGFDAHSFFSPIINNLFKDFSNGDLSLKSGSKAINFGVNGLIPAISQDINGVGRPIGSLPDAGAFEALMAPLPLHWIKNNIEKTDKGISIKGTLADIESNLKVCLEKWNAASNRYDKLDCIYSPDGPVKDISFKQSPGSGNHLYKLIAIKPDGEQIATNAMSVFLNSAIINYFPNPTQNNLHINYPSDDELTAIIYDPGGNKLFSGFVKRGMINVENLIPGKYLVTLLQGTLLIHSDWIIKQ